MSSVDADATTRSHDTGLPRRVRAASNLLSSHLGSSLSSWQKIFSILHVQGVNGSPVTESQVFACHAFHSKVYGGGSLPKPPQMLACWFTEKALVALQLQQAQPLHVQQRHTHPVGEIHLLPQVLLYPREARLCNNLRHNFVIRAASAGRWLSRQRLQIPHDNTQRAAADGIR